MSVIDAPVALPKRVFLTAWGMLDLGELHPIFGTDIHFWADDDASRQMHTRTMELLREHRLARGDRLSPLWTRTLGVLASPGREFYGWSQYLGDGSHGGILVAAHGDDAVRVLADDTTVAIEPVPAKWLASKLLDALPDLDGADVRTVCVPQDFYNDPESARSGPLSDPIDTRDIDYLNAAMGRERDAVHQLYTATRDGAGERRRSTPVTALDLTDGGRVLTYLTGDGEILLTSGTPREVVKTLNDTASGLEA
ncbi:ESX secretion-associated protein EspG [Amycolatopsis sp. lyj-108]|uniref:ESX secretion-associated protein EspG n=1 Tax=Amycolatopsis sp. lyj-108 TaxID=2789286 RepID=UPI003978B204